MKGEEIQTLLRKGVICDAELEIGQILSNAFLQEKNDGTLRLFLNLKNLNQNIEKIHFKMNCFNNAVVLIIPEGRLGMSDISLLSGISGLSFDSPSCLLSCFFLPSPFA